MPAETFNPEHGYNSECEYRNDDFALCAKCAEKYVAKGSPDGVLTEVYYPQSEEHVECEECGYIISHGLECFCDDCAIYCPWCGNEYCAEHCPDCGDNQGACGCDGEEN